ncbi:MAG: Uridylate kinase [Candidatus Bathyarchaeota archaeon BA2]|nr:MAG: Uridylate kinase [Candidatus Bathyarchaeota archaeon BA2]
MKIVVRVGGSVIVSPPNSTLISRYADLLKDLKRQGHEVAAVVGGGALARDFIKIAGELGLDEAKRDWAAIHVSRLFAQLFVMRLGEDGCGAVPVSLDEAFGCLKRGKIVVMGGLKPGMTTDAVAAMMGEKIEADLLVKASDVDGVFTKDPKKHLDAKKIDELGFDDLSWLFEENKHKAGIHQILDPEAVKILEKRRMRIVVVNGFKPENVLLAVKGEKVGTTIR